jgi:hypothetical protein
MENEFLSREINKKLDLIFAEDPGKLLMNIRTHIEKENIRPTSLNIVREHNNFCAVITGEVNK